MPLALFREPDSEYQQLGGISGRTGTIGSAPIDEDSPRAAFAAATRIGLDGVVGWSYFPGDSLKSFVNYDRGLLYLSCGECGEPLDYDTRRWVNDHNAEYGGGYSSCPLCYVKHTAPSFAALPEMPAEVPRPTLRRDACREIVLRVHETERTSSNPQGLPRPEAFAKAIAHSALMPYSPDEIDVTARALSLSADEIQLTQRLVAASLAEARNK